MGQRVGNINNSIVRDTNISRNNTINIEKPNYWLPIIVISTAISIACVLVVLCVVCTRFPRVADLRFDYLGTIIGALSLLVAVFVATQIYQAFTLKHEIYKQQKNLLKEVDYKNERLIREYETLKQNLIELKEKNEKLYKDLENLQADTTFTAVMSFAQKMYDKHIIQYAIDAYFDALNIALTDNLDADRKTAALRSLCTVISTLETNKEDILILPNKRIIYYNIISKIVPQNNDSAFLYSVIRNNVKEQSIELYEPRITSDYNEDSRKKSVPES